MARVTKARFARTMYLKQVLVFYDGPQVVLMQSDRGFPVIGIALDDDSDWFMHFAEVSDDTMRRYFAEKVQLRYLFREGAKRRYIGSWDSLDERGWLEVRRADDITDEAWFPQAGFWSRHHTEDLGQTARSTDMVASFAIDGSWDAADFSKFYGKMADLYALLAVTSPAAAANYNPSTLAAVKTAIRQAGWRGGGSYVGFYDRIFSSIFALSPLRVRRISYASPGHIDLRGSEEPLRDISRVVESFGRDTARLKSTVRSVDKVLTDQSLKTANPDTPFASEASRESMLAFCHDINRSLGVDDPTVLFGMCDGNVLVYAKITLSFYRRAKELYTFHIEGRVEAQGFIDSN